MNENKMYTLSEAHKHLAITTNGLVWQLLEKKERSESEDGLMIHASHASCYHWLQVGTELHHQRAQWLLSHVYCELGIAVAALRHAVRCMDLTKEYSDLMNDFDHAYAFEALSRAYALGGQQEHSLFFQQKAEQAALKIQDEEDLTIFLSDFNGGNWYGLRG
jgi:hypothetical protein